MSRNRTCANCGAWQAPADEELVGTCRLNPPTLKVDGETEFPSAPPHWWCAKWISQRRLTVVDPQKEDA